MNGQSLIFLEQHIKVTSTVDPRRSPEVVMGLARVIGGCQQQSWKENLMVLTPRITTFAMRWRKPAVPSGLVQSLLQELLDVPPGCRTMTSVALLFSPSTHFLWDHF